MNRRSIFKRLLAGAVAIPIVVKGKDLFASSGAKGLTSGQCGPSGVICAPTTPPTDLRTPLEVWEAEIEQETRQITESNPAPYFRYTRWQGAEAWDRALAQLGDRATLQDIPGRQAFVFNGTMFIRVSPATHTQAS